MTRILRVTMWVCVAGAICGLIGWLGPGDRLHHQLHKWEIPFFFECCCVNEYHTECAWDDHFGHPWRSHERISTAGKVLTFACVVVFLILVGGATKEAKITENNDNQRGGKNRHKND